jgi:hypothetical protein
MRTPIIVKLSNTDPRAIVSKAVVSTYPSLAGVMLIGDRETDCMPWELECFQDCLMPEDYRYILTLSQPIIPFAPDFKFVFNRAEFIQIQK